MKKIISISIILFFVQLNQHIKAQSNANKDASSVTSNELEAQSQMFWAVRYFERDSINFALNGFANHPGFLDIISKYGKTKAADLAHYYAGLCYIKKKNYKEAINSMNLFSANDAVVSSLSMGIIGDANMELGDINKAVGYYLKAAYKNNNFFTTPLFLMKAGKTYEILGQYANALKLYNCIWKNYYGSVESREITKYIDRIKGLLSLTDIDTTNACRNLFPNKVSVKENLSSSDIGSVQGKKITYAAFDKKVNFNENVFRTQSGRDSLTPKQTFLIKNDVWEYMIKEKILSVEYDSLGIMVTPAEMNDLIQGEEPHQYIVQNFTNPATGEFKIENVRNFLEHYKDYEKTNPEIKMQWQSLVESIKLDRLNTKYTTLVKEGYFLPKALAKVEYEFSNTYSNLHYIAKRYRDIPDSVITLSAKDYLDYYNEHKQEYAQEETRDIEFIIWKVTPSDSEMAAAKAEVNTIYTELKKTPDKDISSFIKKYAGNAYDSTFYKKGDLPELLDSVVFRSKKESIIGPILEDNIYTLAKVMDIQQRPDSISASHILIAYKGALRADMNIERTKEQANKTADSLLKILKKHPEKFEEICQLVSDDPGSKTNGGDLKWFADQAMVPAFNDACITGKIGEITKVETDFGYHLVKVKGKKDFANKVRLAVVRFAINTSDKTYKDIYAKATKFANENNTIEKFEKAASTEKLNKNLNQFVAPMSDSLNGLESAREIIHWAFNENTHKGDVSKVYDFASEYVVACVKESREKGIPALEEIKKIMEPKVKAGKKAELLISQIKQQQSPGITIGSLAKKLNISAVDSIQYITFTSFAIPSFGNESEAIGKLFSLKPNVLSEPVKGNSAVFVFYIDKIITAKMNNDEYYIPQYLTNYKIRVDYDLYNALLKNAVIVDNRRLFY